MIASAFGDERGRDRAAARPQAARRGSSRSRARRVRRCRSPRSRRARPRRAGSVSTSMPSRGDKLEQRVADGVRSHRSAERAGETRARAEVRDRDGRVRRIAARDGAELARLRLDSRAAGTFERGTAWSSTAMPVQTTCLRWCSERHRRPLRPSARMMWCAIAIGGGMLMPSGCCR